MHSLTFRSINCPSEAGQVQTQSGLGKFVETDEISHEKPVGSAGLTRFQGGQGSEQIGASPRRRWRSPTARGPASAAGSPSEFADRSPSDAQWISMRQKKASFFWLVEVKVEPFPKKTQKGNNPLGNCGPVLTRGLDKPPTAQTIC